MQSGEDHVADPIRKITVILFADIVGYTALMHANEQAALRLLQKFKESLSEQVSRHNGQIIHFYGDGCLAIFDSSVDTIACAQVLQQIFQTEPSVPVRIGLHAGDVVLKEGNVFGDAVNIASRIEGIGVPGSVLLSSTVRNQIKNKEQFEIALIGKFEFKNVEGAMSVYALEGEGLIVPDKMVMAGKGRRLNIESKQKNKKRVFMSSLLGLGFTAIVTVLFLNYSSRNTEEDLLLAEEIREQKVAVAIFENITGDKQLDAIGYLASEWITSSLREIGIKTVAPEMIRQYKDYIGVLPKNPEGKPSLHDITKAEYLVSGSYFTKGTDSIRLHTRLLSTRTGQEIQQFPTIYGKQSDKEGLIEEARQRLMGYWAMENNQHFPTVNPPAYKAYQQFLDCWPGAYDCYSAVLAKDSTFILAHVSLMSAAVWRDFDSLFQSSKSYVGRNWDRCTQYEKNYYHHAVAFREGNFKKAFEYYEANYLLDTMNLTMLHESAWSAASFINRPDIAVDRYNRIFSDYKTFREFVWVGPFYHYADALNRTGQSDRLIEFVQHLPKGDWREKLTWYAWSELYLAYLHTGQLEKAIAYIDTIYQWEPYAYNLSKVAYIWSAFHQDTLPNPFHEQIRGNLTDFMEAEKADGETVWNLMNSGAPFELTEYQAYILQDWEEAERQISQLKRNPPDFMNLGEEHSAKVNQALFAVWIEGLLGSIFARQEKKALAIEQLELLDRLQETFPPSHIPTSRGIIPYYQARIHALLGNKDEAVSYLQKALLEGKPIFLNSFLIDYDLASLRGYAPYEALLRPDN